MQKQRGQVSMPDVLLATSFFLLLLVGMITYSETLHSTVSNQLSRNTLDVTAANLAEYIIKSPGIPIDWETVQDVNNVDLFGLAQKDRVLDPVKVVRFVNLGNLNYSFMQQKLNVSPFNFYIQFTGGVTLSSGIPPPGNAQISVVKRFATINGKDTTITLTLYDT